VSAELAGRVALVTGAAGGLGQAISRALVAAGASVGLVDLKGEPLDALAAELATAAAAFPADLADPEEVRGLPDRVAGHFGRLDIVVNNAGIRTVHPFTEHPLEDWQRALDVNLTAPFLLIQAAVRHLQASGNGAVVNTTSTAAQLAFGNRVAYNVSKAGLAMLTRTAALELGPLGIRCNAVAPGVVETPLNSHYFQDEAFTDLIVSNTPVRHWGTPDDVAGPVVFLCSDASRFVTGATVLVDGGWTTGKGY
jgi:NAD(P)-dependent dehydrogenase (short-subunit alcohol dehydrogenase family)